MEIKLKNVSCDELTQLNLNLKEGEIIAVTGDLKEILLSILKLTKKVTGTISVNGNRLLLKNQGDYQKKIYEVQEVLTYPSMISNVDEYLRFLIQSYQLIFQDEEKKMIDALKLVGLKKEIRFLPLLSLSTTEKKLLQLAGALIVNPEVFLFEEPFLGLDLKNQKKYLRIFTKLKEHYHKTILFSTENCEQIYQYADSVVILKDGMVLSTGKVEEVYSQSEFLRKYEIPIPKAISFSDKVKEKKGISLDSYKDIRDLIKEIYRKV